MDWNSAVHRSNDEACGCNPFGIGRVTNKHNETIERSPSDSDLLAKDLAKLSMNERSKLLHDIHGVADMPNEDPGFVVDCLTKMENEIKRIQEKDKLAYSKALFLAPSRVKDDEFRIMFLRATDFDPQRAAEMTIAHFKHKLELFGEEKLVKRITWEDLNDDDITSLKAGSHLFLREKDRAGRAVMLLREKLITVPKSFQNYLRAHWYQVMTMVQDEEIQKKGCVMVGYEIGRTVAQGQYFNDIIASIPVCSSLPLRVAAFHFCYDNSTVRAFLLLFRRVAGSKMRVRFRDHFGSHQECQYELMSFGIPQSLLYFDESGILKMAKVLDYASLLREKETHFSGVWNDDDNVATKHDVLLGRGKPFRVHSGNMALARLIEQYQGEYMEGDRFEKTAISWNILSTIQDGYGGRFIEKDERTGAWQVVSQDCSSSC